MNRFLFSLMIAVSFLSFITIDISAEENIPQVYYDDEDYDIHDCEEYENTDYLWFQSYFSFEDYIHTSREDRTCTWGGDKFDDINAQWIYDEKGVYLPEGLNIWDITSVRVYADRIEYLLPDNGNTFHINRFTAYYDKADIPPEDAKKVKYNGRHLAVKDDTIYWTEDGRSYTLWINEPKENRSLTLLHFVEFEKGLVWRGYNPTYINEKGNTPHGWVKCGDSKVYILKDGTAAVGTKMLGGVMYEFDDNGILKGKYSGWITDEKGNRYFTDGVYATGKQTIAKKTYVFDDKGYTQKPPPKEPTCHYFDEDGTPISQEIIFYDFGELSEFMTDKENEYYFDTFAGKELAEAGGVYLPKIVSDRSQIYSFEIWLYDNKTIKYKIIKYNDDVGIDFDITDGEEIYKLYEGDYQKSLSKKSKNAQCRLEKYKGKELIIKHIQGDNKTTIVWYEKGHSYRIATNIKYEDPAIPELTDLVFVPFEKQRATSQT